MTEEAKPEEDEGIVLKDEHVKGGTREYRSLCMKSIVKGQTSVGDDTFWVEFEGASGDVFRTSYPIGKGQQGKLAQFLKSAREVLGLESGADVDMTQLIGKTRAYRRVSRHFKGVDDEDVNYFFFVLTADENLAVEDKEEDEQYAELIEKMQSGVTREEIYEVAKGLEISTNDVDLFMMNANSKKRIVKEGDKYTWVAAE